MITKALRPEECQQIVDIDAKEIELQDIEVEATVAKINCIIAREFEGVDVEMPCDVVDSGSLGYLGRTKVLQRFRDRGWKIESKERVALDPGSLNGMIKRYYVFVP